MDNVARIRPSLWHCLWGVLLILIGGGFFARTLFHGIMHVTDSLTEVVVPGTQQLNLVPGRYTVFLEEESVVNGKVYSTTGSIAGLSCRVQSVSSGAAIPIGPAQANVNYSVSGRSGRSVLEFSIARQGQYAFACDYGENAKGPDVVVAVGSGVGEAIARTVGGSIASMFGGGIAGVLVILFVVLRRERAKRRQAQSGRMQI